MPQSEVTPLTPAEENAYRQWLNASRITDAEQPDAHYDYRGLFKELKGQAVPTSTNRHFPDTYKQHGHPTFSIESKYSTGANDGGRWEGDKYVAGQSQQTFEVTAPNGQTLEITGDRIPTEAELRNIFKSAGVDTGGDKGLDNLGAVNRFLSGALRTNPITTGVDFLSQMATDPKGAGKAVLDPSVEYLHRAIAANRAGKPLEALGEGASAVPLIGPYVRGGVDRMRSGDVAGGMGELAWLASPAVKKGAGLATDAVVAGGKKLAPGMMNAAADALDVTASEKLAKIISPQTGPNKPRLGNQAARVAPDLLRDPELGAYSRTGLAGKLEERLQQATDNLDVAADSRLASQQVRTRPLIAALDKHIAELTAQPVEASRRIPSVVGAPVREVPTNPTQQYALQWMQDEMESFPFVKRTWNEAPRKSGNAGDYDIVPGAAGAPIYNDIVGQGLVKATRSQVVQAIKDVRNGNTSGKLRQLVVGVANDLVEGNRQSSMRTPGPIPDAMSNSKSRIFALDSQEPAQMPAMAGRPFGQPVEPAPNAAQLSTLRQIRDEVSALGPTAPYESVRRIRQAWDQVAKVKYLPATAADALKSKGDATAAAKGTSAMREALAQVDPESAKAYQQYSVMKAGNDVIQAAEEADRVRPNRGRGIMARSAGAMIGAKEGGIVGAGIGAVVAGIVDKAAEMAPTFQIQVARKLAAVADALRVGDTVKAQAMTEQITQSFPAVKTGLKVVGKASAMAGRATLPLAADNRDETAPRSRP